MQTNFSATQLADPELAEANQILRACVHCGMCTTACPTFRLLGDELDSPRGRIYLVKELLETGKAAGALVATHLDRCLTCLSCMTACPADVDYHHLVDLGRAHVERTYRRPLRERLVRRGLVWLLPRPAAFRLALMAALPFRPVARVLPGLMGRLLRSAPARIEAPGPAASPATFLARGERRMRVALLAGCVQQVLSPAINEATVRLLTRLGCEVVIAPRAGCCGALAQHLGETDAAREAARRNVAAWARLLDDGAGGLDAVVVNASGCGTQVKDYGHLLKDDPAYGENAARIAGLARDVTEVLERLEVSRAARPARALPVVAYHSACSLQHGQRIHELPRRLLADAGFDVRDVPQGHICCGSAGTYSLLQGELSERLLAEKIANLARTGADVVAAGNIGCIAQIAGALPRPVVHTVELLDWASGGPEPGALKRAGRAGR
jgi:glycolate oxidase iron-sulfur subunit